MEVSFSTCDLQTLSTLSSFSFSFSLTYLSSCMWSSYVPKDRILFKMIILILSWILQSGEYNQMRKRAQFMSEDLHGGHRGCSSSQHFFSVAVWVIFLVAACRIFSCGIWTLSCPMWGLVPWLGIEPGPVALAIWSLSHWTTREVLKRSYLGQSIGEECVQSREHRAAIWWTYRNSVSLGVYNKGMLLLLLLSHVSRVRLGSTP